MKILFVCTGNTCRSPLAQAVLQQIIDRDNIAGIEVDSAGLCCGFGEPMSNHTSELIEEMGIFFTHTSQPVTQKLLEECSMVVTMTAAHKEMLAGFVDGGKLFSFEELSQEGEVADPYGGDSADYLACVLHI